MNQETSTSSDLPVAVIRTTDRAQFRNCRRKWFWGSHMREGLEPLSYPLPFWFGTGIHFALEDFHGYRKFDRASEAWLAYVAAQESNLLKDAHEEEIADHINMGVAMMDYYQDHWLKNRSPLETLWIDGVPQVEVNITAPIDIDLKKLGLDHLYSGVVYSATLDRVVQDKYGNIWALDYKTAKTMRTTHLENDPQAAAYSWIAHKHYGKPIQGLIYWQFLKCIPKIKMLNNGQPSTNKNFRASHSLFREACLEAFGDPANFSSSCIDHLHHLALQEDEDGDAFIRRNYIYRNETQHEAEGTKVLLELEEMLNPSTPLYPNPGFMCGMCSFFDPCTSLDSGHSWQEQIDMGFTKRISPTEEQQLKDNWRSKINDTK